MRFRSMVKKFAAGALAVAIGISSLPEAIYAAGQYGKTANVYGNVEEAPDVVDLTRTGSKDWIHFNSNVAGSWERKELENSLINQVRLLGEPESLARDTKSNFVYQDGTSGENSPEDNHIGLILYGMDNGVNFQLPGSEKEQLLRLYVGSWASEVTVTVSVNGTAAYEETFGKTETTQGGKSFEHEIHYKTASEQDMVSVEVKTTELYDQSWGNINIQAVALAEAGDKTEVSAAVSTLEGQPEILLSQEGNVDWMYFNSVDLANYEYKNLPEPYMENVEAINGTNGLTADKFAFFRYEDGALNETNSNSCRTEKKGIIFNNAGNGMTFDVAGCTHERILRIYTGTYQAKVGIEVYVNDDAAPLESVEYICQETQGKMTEIRFQTEYPEDILHIKIVAKETMDSTYGSVSVHAVTLYDENPPEIHIPDYTQEVLGDEKGMVQVDHAKGKINSLKFKEAGGDWLVVPFTAAGAYAGPSWKVDGTMLKVKRSEDNAHIYTAVKDGITYGIRYGISEDGILTVTVSMKNDTEESFEPEQASIVLGLDTYMQDTYDSYKGLFFPTLLRCEKTHLWGYMESPGKKVVSLAVDSPVSSYHLEYQSGQHRIYTAVLDLMQKDETLPERHPRNNSTLNAGETRNWNIKMKVSEKVDSVKADVEQMLKAPVIDADRYTLGAGEKSKITVYSAEEPGAIQVTTPEGNNSELALEKVKDGVYTAEFLPESGQGIYKLVVQSGGYQAEAMITLRQTWKWYMEKAKEAAISHPAKGADCAESWYNLYSAYLGEKYFPDEQQQKQIDDKFEEIYERVICYSENGVPANNPSRIQNHSTTLGILVDKYEAQGNVQDLIRAAKIADYLMGRQDEESGAYIGPTGDYTSVIYPAKSLMELMKQEAELIDQGDTSYAWQECYDKHYDSVKRAMDNLVRLKGDLHTEGQLTFEDGAFSCSATQLSEFALMHEPGSSEREKYMQSALDYLDKHQALEQEIIPDSRINGGSLRFWEAQYDVLLQANPNNMMNSPHGWTAWNIYGLFNMYQLTGEEYYLRKGMNAIGSCVQLMGFDGNLNWAFIADPYIKGSLFVQKENDTSEYGEAERKSVVLGESYVDMISDWWKAPPDTNVGGYYGQGGACDNDVHEIFKAMEETVLTKAYVIEQEDGTLAAYNCTAVEREDGALEIRTIEGELTQEVSLNLKDTWKYEIYFTNTDKKVSGTAGAGMGSVKENEIVTDPLEALKADAKGIIGNYKNMQDYRAAQQEELQRLIAQWQAEVGNAQSEEEITQAVESAKAALDAILTDAALTKQEKEAESLKQLERAKADAKAVLEDYRNAAGYQGTQKKELEAAILAGIQAVYAASTKEDVEMALAQAKDVIAKILLDAGQEEKRVSGISLNSEELTLDRGGKFVLQVVITPSTAENKAVLYKSSNSQIAKVSADGTVKAQREGTAVITATTAEGQKAANCKVTVRYRGKWIKKKRRYRFKLRNGKYLKKSWKMVGRKFAYMDKKGYRLTGKQKVGKDTYYFSKKGIMQTGFKKIGRNVYYFGKDGKMKTGLQIIKKKKYYFNRKGIMQTGWIKIKGKKQYFKA